MAAPAGNSNAAKSRLFEQAVIREIKQRDIKDGEGETLRKIAARMVDAAMNGDAQTIRDLRDTLDGKPKQQTELTGADGKDLFAGTVATAETLRDALRGS